MCGWREPGEDACPRAGSVSPPVAADQRGVQQLDRGPALEAAVAALGQPDAAHAAVADRRHERVGADASRRPAAVGPAARARRRRGSPPRSEARCSSSSASRSSATARIVAAAAIASQAARSAGVQVQRLVEVRAERVPAAACRVTSIESPSDSRQIGNGRRKTTSRRLGPSAGRRCR